MDPIPINSIKSLVVLRDQLPGKARFAYYYGPLQVDQQVVHAGIYDLQGFTEVDRRPITIVGDSTAVDRFLSSALSIVLDRVGSRVG